MLCTSGFVDDVMFPVMGPMDTVAVLLQCCKLTNTPAAGLV